MSDTPETHATIRYTADVVAVTDDGRVLLIKRSWDPYENHWALPGGHVDHGETGLQAAARHAGLDDREIASTLKSAAAKRGIQL